MLQWLRRKDAMKDLRGALHDIKKRLDELSEKFDDRKIAESWVELAKQRPTELVTVSNLALSVRRTPAGFNKVAYTAFLANNTERVAWMHCQAPTYGRVQITNANVYEVHGVDYRHRGIGTAIYDLIERDVRAVGGSGIEPHWGSMSEEAIAFWKKRRPDQAAHIETLNRLGPGLATGLFD
jgi:hypothetical protein